MSESQNEKRVRLDLNNEVFQGNLLAFDKAESTRVLATLRKLRQMTWSQVYRDTGLNWEKIASVTPPKGIDAIYSLRTTKARRATAYRDADYMRFLNIQIDHDSTCVKK